MTELVSCHDVNVTSKVLVDSREPEHKSLLWPQFLQGAAPTYDSSYHASPNIQ